MQVTHRYCDLNSCGEKAFSLTLEAKTNIKRLFKVEVEDICVECATMLASSSSLPLLLDDENEEIDIKCCWNCSHFEQEIKREHFSEFSICCKDKNSLVNVEHHYRCESWEMEDE